MSIELYINDTTDDNSTYLTDLTKEQFKALKSFKEDSFRGEGESYIIELAKDEIVEFLKEIKIDTTDVCELEQEEFYLHAIIN